MTAATPESGSGDSNSTMYIIVGAVVALLAVIGLVTYSGKKTGEEAEQKAQQLSLAFEQAGLSAPAHQEIITRSLGNDGGAVCDNPANALGRATLLDQMSNGADFVGRRPVIVDPRILVGEALILQVYCPEKLQEYKDKIADLKTDDVIKD